MFLWLFTAEIYNIMPNYLKKKQYFFKMTFNSKLSPTYKIRDFGYSIHRSITYRLAPSIVVPSKRRFRIVLSVVNKAGEINLTIDSVRQFFRFFSEIPRLLREQRREGTIILSMDTFMHFNYIHPVMNPLI